MLFFLSWGGEGEEERGEGKGGGGEFHILNYFIFSPIERHNPSVEIIVGRKKTRLQVPITGFFMVNINIVEGKRAVNIHSKGSTPHSNLEAKNNPKYSRIKRNKSSECVLTIAKKKKKRREEEEGGRVWGEGKGGRKGIVGIGKK